MLQPVFQKGHLIMNFKFSVGQTVEYAPRGGRAGMFTTIRHMPEEHDAFDLKYRIKIKTRASSITCLNAISAPRTSDRKITRNRSVASYEPILSWSPQTPHALSR